MTSLSQPRAARADALPGTAETVSRARSLPPEDLLYLEQLARDTWTNIAWLVHPGTGLPYDNNKRDLKNTSVSNIGLYAAAVVGAFEMGFITRAEALERLGRLMDGLEKFRHWNGFCQSWNNIETFQPSPDDTWISILDSGNLAGGLLVVKQAFPELAGRVGRYLDAMDWSRFYDAEKNEFYGGYNMATGAFNRDWKQVFLGSDSRLVSLIAIGTGKVAPQHWDILSRETEERYGLKYLVPGWQGGGLFMQFISGLFIDDRGTLLGSAAARFAYAQMFHARVIDSPVWGWSASDSPNNGYLGWQALKDNVATPHASSLPLSWFPRECVADLRKFEELGARASLVVDGEERAFGYRDALDLDTRQVTRTYLVLDQGMLFLSLVNALKDGAVWRYAAKDPVVARGRELASDYRADRVDVPAFWKEIDSLRAAGPQVCVNPLKAPREFAPRASFRVPVRFVSDGTAEGRYQLWWRVMEEKSGRYAKQGKISVAFPLQKELSVALKLPPGIYLLQTALVGGGDSLLSESALTFRVSSEDSELRRQPLLNVPPLSWEDERARWALRSLDLYRWDFNTHKDATAGLRKVKDGDAETAQIPFSFRQGEWVELVRTDPGDFSRLKRISLQHRYDGDPVRLEIKLEDEDGSVFGFSKPLSPSRDWALTRVDVDRMKHLWGGDGTLNLTRVKKFMLAVAGPVGAHGTLTVKSLAAFSVPGE